jgi:hypothetical protein
MATNQHAATEELLDACFLWAVQRLGKRESTTIEKLCFLRGPFRDVITGTVWATS